MDAAKLPGTWLAPNDFLAVLTHAPLVSMDLIVRDGEGRVLLGLRRNRPAQGTWFVPGGRIVKGERFTEAFRRISEAELGTAFDLDDAKSLGVFEHLYEDNAFNQPGIGTHYVVLGFELKVDAAALRLPEAQHGDYRWCSPEELRVDPGVHANTKAYFP